MQFKFCLQVHYFLNVLDQLLASFPPLCYIIYCRRLQMFISYKVCAPNGAFTDTCNLLHKDNIIAYWNWQHKCDGANLQTDQ